MRSLKTEASSGEQASQGQPRRPHQRSAETATEFIHDLQTRADPAGDVRTIHELREQNAGMQKSIETLQRKIQRVERKKNP